jgi:hypothetical protein
LVSRRKPKTKPLACGVISGEFLDFEKPLQDLAILRDFNRPMTVNVLDANAILYFVGHLVSTGE